MADPYLQVNVYPAQGGWYMVAILKEPGRPHGRLLDTIRPPHKLPGARDFPSALRAASEELLVQAANLK